MWELLHIMYAFLLMCMPCPDVYAHILWIPLCTESLRAGVVPLMLVLVVGSCNDIVMLNYKEAIRELPYFI